MGNIIVLFEVTIKEGKMEDYLKRASELKEYLKNIKGFVRAERFSSLATEGKLLSMTVWENEESVEQWRNLEAHRLSQKAGRDDDFIDYKITVVKPYRSYSMKASYFKHLENHITTRHIPGWRAAPWRRRTNRG